MDVNTAACCERNICERVRGLRETQKIFANEWETDVNTADASNVMGHLCQDCLQLGTVDCGRQLKSSRSDFVHMQVE